MSQFIFTKFEITPRLEEDKAVYEEENGSDLFDLEEGKEVYFDGSCLHNSLRVAKAGAGIVQEKPEDKAGSIRSDTLYQATLMNHQWWMKLHML